MISSAPNLLLIQAARLGNQPKITAALESGADVNATDAQGTSALMFSAQKGLQQIVGLLIAAGADFIAVSNAVWGGDEVAAVKAFAKAIGQA